MVKFCIGTHVQKHTTCLLQTKYHHITCWILLLLLLTVHCFFLQVVIVDLGFTTLLTSQVISVAFYNEHEKSDKFCWEALILAWDSFTCCKSTTRDPWLYFPSEGSHTQDLYALKNPSTPAGFEPAHLRSSGEYDNHGTTGVIFFLTRRAQCDDQQLQYMVHLGKSE